MIRSLRAGLGYLALLLAVLSLNLVSSSGFNFWVLCFVPIGLATWNLGGKAGSALVVVATLALAVLAFDNPRYPTVAHMLVSVSSKTLAFALVVRLIVLLRVQEIGRLFIPAPRPPAKKHNLVR